MHPLRELKKVLIIEANLWNDVQDYFVMERIDKAKIRCKKYKGNSYNNYCTKQSFCPDCFFKIICKERTDTLHYLSGDYDKNQCKTYFKSISKILGFFDECLEEMELRNKFFIGKECNSSCAYFPMKNLKRKKG